MRSPTRPSACLIGNNAELASAELDRDEPQQLGGRHTLPTADTRAHRQGRVSGLGFRGRVTIHQEVYPALSARVAAGPPT